MRIVITGIKIRQRYFYLDHLQIDLTNFMLDIVNVIRLLIQQPGIKHITP